MKKLTNKEKIEVLERAIKELSERRAFGLCIIIRHCLKDNNIYCGKIDNYIDLFTFENSKKFSSIKALEGGHWFKVSSDGDAERIKFLEWMIQEYKKREKKRKLKIIGDAAIITAIIILVVAVIVGFLYLFFYFKTIFWILISLFILASMASEASGVD